MTIQDVSLKAEGLERLPDGVGLFKLVDQRVVPIEWTMKWTDYFEEELVFLSRAGVRGYVEVMGEEGEYVKYVLKDGVVEVYEGAVVYPDEPSTILGK